MTESFPDFQSHKDEIIHSLLNRSYEVEVEGSLPPSASPQALQMALVSEEDKLILMHRDAHFGANFDIMIAEYLDEKRGAVLDVEVSQIKALQKKQQELQSDIAPLLLTGAEAERVMQAKKMYRDLRALSESATQDAPKEKKKPVSSLIAELILSDDDTSCLLEEIIACKGDLQQELEVALIELLESDLFKDPLFPGYGLAPKEAAYALGRLQSKKSIPYLFRTLCQEGYDYEEVITSALHAIGDDAKEFLKRQFQQKPMTKITELALVCLLSFATDADVSEFLLEHLEQKDYQKQSFSPYLVLGLESLPPHLQKRAEALKNDVHFPQNLQQELQFVLKCWEKNNRLYSIRFSTLK